MLKRCYKISILMLTVVIFCGCAKVKEKDPLVTTGFIKSTFEETFFSSDAKMPDKTDERAVTSGTVSSKVRSELATEQKTILQEIKYMTFEETLLAATNVVVATYTGEYETNGIYRDLIFVPVKQLKGVELTEYFYVSTHEHEVEVAGHGITYRESSSQYVAGKTYILVLEKVVSVYQSHDVYMPMNNILIDTNGAASMYGSDSLADHSAALSANSGVDDISAYITSFVEANVGHIPAIIGTEYIRSNDIAKITEGTSLILRVTPTECIGGSENNHTEQYLCHVDEILKGAVSAQQIMVVFMEDTIVAGSKYVIMVEPLGNFYILSSQNSVHPVSDTTTISQIEAKLAICE